MRWGVKRFRAVPTEGPQQAGPGRFLQDPSPSQRTHATAEGSAPPDNPTALCSLAISTTVAASSFVVAGNPARSIFCSPTQASS
jgi:hypothetical protein